MRVTCLRERHNVPGQHAADFLKIFLPVATEVVRKPGDEALQRIHLMAGKMTLRNASPIASDPNRRDIFRSGPEFNERGLRIKPRLDRVKCESIGRKLVAKKLVLKTRARLRSMNSKALAA